MAVRVSARVTGTRRTSSLIVRGVACDGPTATSTTLLARRAVRAGRVSVEAGLPTEAVGAYRITAELRTSGGRTTPSVTRWRARVQALEDVKAFLKATLNP